MRSICIVGLAALSVGCLSNDPSPSRCNLLEVIHKSSTVTYSTSVYEYDDLGRLKTLRQYSDGIILYFTQQDYHYSVDDNPDSIVYSQHRPNTGISVLYQTYIRYDNLRHPILFIGSDTGDTTRLDYNSHGQIIRKIYKFRQMFIPGFRLDTIQYSYPNTTTRNYDTLRQPGHPALIYTYDEYEVPRPFGFTIDFLLHQRDNNVLSANFVGAEVSRYTYVYDDNNRPLILNPGETAATYYKYDCNQ